VEENMYKNRRGHQAATNGQEWEMKRKVSRLVIIEGRLRLLKIRYGNVKKK
jgi:hypothetical protein